MGIPAIEQNYPFLNLTGASKGINHTGYTPYVAPVSTGNEYGISIPQNHSYTTDENGTRISMGQDGVGLAHRNPAEFNFHLIG